MTDTRWSRRAVLAAGIALAATGCSSSPRGSGRAFEPMRFQEWSGGDPAYRLYPGDEIEVTVHTADELSRTVTVAPDGRANLPLVGAVMVAEKTAPEASRAIADGYSRVLRDPIVEVRPVSFGSQRILVGGEVNAPGPYALPDGRTGVLEAVMLAGGFQPTARRNQVVVLRRASDGGAMLRTVDVRGALRGRPADTIPLARHDVVFVPRSGIAEVNLFVDQYVRGILPLDAGFNYLLYELLRD
ncbi:MAG: polysaccharide export protein [Oceanicaulis sp.]|uniref:polysaccharide biosynthesis/export family protein n=1 Tax=Glycocaulis sp. TaxID=1969725 RepID=UPI0025BC1147|nr:polysaccharide biosynthesis/export family protein [Glycocaulis sp.]MCC5982435.1 polysaccharide export protein [Oceanicaulis sp.]MCH8521260.1 polysaccharide export protein [Glycocaulis sp.]